MPWKNITRLSGYAFAATFVVLTGVCAAGLRRERLAAEEAARFANRWKDENRWP